ncbi:unnamed protein product [Rotaria socialis]|uniref:Uncharacterized protein n=1 Tax=Rotaria socialis TaxID=392032 RepID=A0A820BVY0_9BILA|nr:unnamed protein product [Rotaria socialis]CAF3323461.1 unnamed protein product [Rotaria socialis]CAF3417176.1 unnamed protein product [Rotaria socialis]CAF4212392.1 unnamed protein product [Rotaria socialis]CAF4250827.1 unnamed protein product [Rotaria socialis]
MNTSLAKRTCSHRFIDQHSGKCLHCGNMKTPIESSITKHEPPLNDNENNDEDYGSLELEHYERLVLMLDEWKKTMINRIESIYKSKIQRLRDEFEGQQAARRRSQTEQKNKIEIDDEQEKAQLTNIKFELIQSAFIDTEYTLMATSSETIFVHDGRTFKLFDKSLRPLVALDLTTSMRERFKVVDLCYISYLSSYLILYEQGLWVFQPGSNANLITAIQRRGYLSLTTNTKDLFILDIEGTIEQRSIISWTFLRRYTKHHLLNENINDQLLSIRFHSVEYTILTAIVRTSNNRRCLMTYKHYGSNTFKLLERILFPNINIYSISSIHMSHVWLLTTCEKQSFFFIDNKREYNQREQQQVWFPIDCDYRIKNAIEFGTNQRSILIRTIRPSQLGLYHF